MKSSKIPENAELIHWFITKSKIEYRLLQRLGTGEIVWQEKDHANTSPRFKTYLRGASAAQVYIKTFSEMSYKNQIAEEMGRDE